MTKTEAHVNPWVAALNPAQRKARNAILGRIHCIARELCFIGDRKDLLDMQVQIATGGTSLSELDSFDKLKAVLRQLDKVLGTHRRQQTKAASEAGNMIQLPTPDQREHANRLLADLTPYLGLRNPQGYLNGIAQKACGKDVDRLNRLEFAQILEALKKIRSRF